MNNEQLTLTYNLIIETFNQRNCIYEEGLMAMSSLANSNSEDYINLMDQSSKYQISYNPLRCRVKISFTSGECMSPSFNIEEIIKKATLRIKKEKEQADEDKENNSLDASTITNAINNAAAGLKH